MLHRPWTTISSGHEGKNQGDHHGGYVWKHFEGQFPYKIHSGYMEIDKKCHKYCFYHIQTLLSHKNSNLLHITLSYNHKGLYSWTICIFGGWFDHLKINLKVFPQTWFSGSKQIWIRSFVWGIKSQNHSSDLKVMRCQSWHPPWWSLRIATLETFPSSTVAFPCIKPLYDFLKI